MPKDATDTKGRILDAAQGLVLERGFAGTSVDDIQRAAGISRGTFFYHFPSKDDLARALIERYAEADNELTDGLMRRAEKLARDPLQQALIFLALHEEMLDEEGPAGCLFASYSYEAGLFDERTHDLITGAIEHFRRVLGDKLAEAIECHPPRVPGTDPYLLADMAAGLLQGAFILRRALDDPGLMAAHVRQFRNHLELLFGVVGSAAGDGAADTA
jgi:TetR/AcrR family transcriptional repressor of nem operon